MSISARLDHVRQAIAAAARGAARLPDSVLLIAVSKTFGPDAVIAAADAGQRAFGENYLQEALDKKLVVAAARPELALEWHFIGPIQSNKTRPIAENFDWVHTIDRFKIAERLSAQRPHHCPPLQICLQVNISEEPDKAGLSVSDVLPMAQLVSQLPRLTLRGLMSIPQAQENPALQAVSHRRLRELLNDLRAHGLSLDTLSMGMSADLAVAIEQGSTMVRVGSAVFGGRTKKI